jgi:hypothetical protein
VTLTESQLIAGLTSLGVTREDIEKLTQASSYDEAMKFLQALKRKAKLKFRSLAKELHPDLHEGDPAKTEQFRILREVIGELDKVRLSKDESPSVHTRSMRTTRSRRVFISLFFM